MAQETQEMTPNQVVAWNLWQERKRRGWTQEQMSERLARHGIVWKKATYYAAEASREPGTSKPRQFTADEIIAFALAFDRPVVSFLVPPPEATVILSEERVSRVRLMEAGVAEDIADMRDLAERLRATATAIEVFEEARQPKSAAQVMVEWVDEMARKEHPEWYGETGQLRQRKEAAERAEWRLAKAREWIQRALLAEPEIGREAANKEIAETLNFFSDVVPPSDDPDAVIAFVNNIRAELEQQEEKGTA
jgi:transcriptional regulator with XRE-family HTH domain